MICHVINLPARTDRLTRFQWFAQQADIQPAVFAALDGSTLTPPADYRSSAGAYGCARSHVELLGQVTGTDPVLIAEDDTILPYNTEQILTDSLAVLPDDWRVLLLGIEHTRMAKPVNDLIVQPTRFEHLHAYLVNGGTYAAWMAEIADEASFHWDLYFSRATEELTGVYSTTWPWLVYPSASDIADSVPVRNRREPA